MVIIEKTVINFYELDKKEHPIASLKKSAKRRINASFEKVKKERLRFERREIYNETFV